MKIDVIIPVYRPDEKFIRLIEMLSRQTIGIDKIIVINTEKSIFDSFDEKYGFSKAYPGVELFHIKKEDFDHGKTRNFGMSKADGDIAVMMTQDAVPESFGLIGELIKNLSGNVAVSYARQLPGKDSGLLETVSREFNYPDKSLIKTEKDIEALGIKAFFCSDVCAAYRLDIFRSLGGFTNRAIFNEDMIYAHKALKNGYAVSYEAGARVIHSHKYSNMAQLHRNFDLGVSQADNPEVFMGVSSESEGKKLVKSAWKRLLSERKVLAFIPFCIQCFFKLLGFKLGKNYRSLPKKLVYRLTTNVKYFESK